MEFPKRDAMGPTACRGGERENLAGNSQRLVSVVNVFLQGLFSLGGFVELSEMVEQRLAKRPVKKYSSRNELHRRMLDRHPAFGDFVKGGQGRERNAFPLSCL